MVCVWFERHPSTHCDLRRGPQGVAVGGAGVSPGLPSKAMRPHPAHHTSLTLRTRVLKLHSHPSLEPAPRCPTSKTMSKTDQLLPKLPSSGILLEWQEANADIQVTILRGSAGER